MSEPKHVLEAWPLEREFLNNAVMRHGPDFQQVACMHMPMSIFRPNAKRFCDFVDNGKEDEVTATAWRGFSSSFYALAEKAERVKGSKAYLCLEYVPSKDEPLVPAGYTWWLFYNPPPPPVQPDDGLGVSGVGFGEEAEQPEEHPREWRYLDWMAYNKVIGHYRNSERAAIEKGEDFQRTMSRTDTPWKCIPSFNVWEDFVSLVTQWDYVRNDEATNGLPSHCVTQFDFSPRTAFVMRGDDVAETHHLSRMCPSLARLVGASPQGTYMNEMHVPSANTPKSSVTWPQPELIYNVPIELITYNQLYRKMLPHRQRDEANTACQLTILLPKLAALCDTSAAARVAPEEEEDAEMDEAENAETGVSRKRRVSDRSASSLAMLAMQAAHGNAANRSHNKRQRLAQIMGAHNMMAGPSRKFGTEALAAQKADATPYQQIANVLKKVTTAVFRSMQEKPIMARKLIYISQQAGLREYINKTASTPMMSAPMRMILRAIGNRDLLKITPEIETFFARPQAGYALDAGMGTGSDGLNPDGSSGLAVARQTMPRNIARLSPLGSYFRKMLLVLELVKHMNHMHKWFLIAMICGMDALRHSFGLHLHLLLHTMRGGVGKSLIWALIRAIFIMGCVVEPQYETAASGTAIEKVGEYNRSDEIIIEDEKSKKDLSSKTSDTSGKLERDKHEMTNGYSEVRGIMFDDDGNRILTTAFVTRSCVKMSSTNNPTIDGPLRSRYWAPHVPEGAPGERHIADTMNQEALDPREIKVVDDTVADIHHFFHAVMAHVEKIAESLIFTHISDDVCGIMAMALTQKLRQNNVYSEVNVRVFYRKRLVARQLCLRRNIIDLITVNGKVEAHRIARMEPHELVAHLPRRLFVSVEDYVAAAGICAEDLLDPLEIGIRMCMKRIWDQAAARQGANMRSMFRSTQYEVDPEATAAEHTHARGNKKYLEQVDYSYLKFNSEDLYSQIHMNLPRVMMGFVSNVPAIRETIHSFTERSVRSWGYDCEPRPVTLFDAFTTHHVHIESPAPRGGGEVPQQPAVICASKVVYVHINFIRAVYSKEEQAMDRIAMAQVEANLALQSPIPTTFVMNVGDLGPSMGDDDGADSADSTSDASSSAATHSVPTDGTKVKTSLSASIILDALQSILSRDGMCEREMMFAPRLDEPKMMHTFKSGPMQRDPTDTSQRGPLVLNKVTVADANDLILFPELRKMVPAYEEMLKKDVTFAQDLDTYALQEHNKRTGFLADTAVSPNFLDDLETHLTRGIDGERSPQHYFAGVPVERVHPDAYEKFVESNLETISAILSEPAKPGDLDVDFNDKEFMYKSRVTGQVVNHWDRLHQEGVDARPFGFRNGWGDTTEERRHNYRQVCYHPALREHLYQELGV